MFGLFDLSFRERPFFSQQCRWLNDSCFSKPSGALHDMGTFNQWIGLRENWNRKAP